MASVTEPRPPQNPIGKTPGKGELLVDEQIRRTRRALKVVDWAAGMISLVIGVLMFLLSVAALDHWVIPGGWGTGGRTVLFLMLVVGVGWHGWHVFWPLLRLSINPAYAAQAIEQSSPALKNSLLNFLLLRKRKQRISRQVYQAIEYQAARGLSQVPMDSVVDRSAVLRLGYLLLAVVAVCALYRVLSPKDLFTSAGRVLLPWTNVIAPSRVQLSAITPGDTQTAKGERIAVSVEALGLDQDEPVRLLYSTADQQIVGQEILMGAGAGGVRFEAKLPQRTSEGGGVQQDLTYWIEAGDARSPAFQVSVFARPTLVVQSVRYNYPDYTGYPSHEETNTGDLHAVEGTVVTITALSNQPIETAHVDFDADGRHDLLMKVESQQATVSFPLELRDDRQTPQHQSYVLRYSTTKGRKNRLPPTYQIEVTPDYSPEVRLLNPEEEIVEVGLDDQVTIEVEARDPDFAIRNVAILGEVAGQQVLKETLLSKKNHTGRFVGQMQLTPSKQGLKAGDVLEYWGAAADNRRPKPNLAFTNHHKIRVIGPGQEGEQASDQQGEGNGGEGESQPAEGESDSADEGSEESGGESDESGGESGEQGQEGQGQSGAGEAGEGMADEQNQQQGGKAGEGESNEGNEDSQSEAEGQAGGKSEGEPQDGESSESEGGENSSDGEPSDEQASGNQEKVSPDGDDDAEAFDRMVEHFDEQENDSGGDPTENDDPSGAGKGEQQEGQGDASDGTADPDQSNHGEGTEAGEAGNSDSAEGMPQENDSEGGGAEGDPSEQQGEGSDQEGEQSEDDTGAEGQMSKEQGEAGAGENPGDNEGTTASEDGQSPEEKQGDKSADQQNDEEAPSEGQGKTESDSEGSQGGDRSGGGQEGSGQQADADGKGGAGEHQAADQGGSKSEQPGEGETSEQPGGEKQSDGVTGESSQDQSGNGEKSSDQAGGEKQGESGESQQGEAGENMPSEGEPSDQPSDSGQESAAGSNQPTEGGGQGGEGSPPPPSGETEAGDEANLDYARKQTDLILDKLDDQLEKKEVDEKLLEKLSWSEEELRRFVERWKNLKSQAESKDESAAAAAQQQLDEALQSLGLGRNRRTGFQSQTAKDKLRELQDSYRGKIPLKYQQRVRAYIKGTAGASDEE